MKKIFQNILLISAMMVTGALVACGEPTNSTTLTPTTTQPADKYNCITIAQAIEYATTAGEAGSSETYFLRGKIEEITSYNYGEMTISDDTGSIYVYGVYGKDDTFFNKLENQPAVGDTIVIEGKLKTYKGKPEVDKAILHEFTEGEKQEIDISNYKAVTIAEARSSAIDSNLIIEGVVAKTTYADGMVPNGIYVIDNTGSIYVHGYETAALAKEGHKVKIAGTRTNYILDTEKTLAQKLGYQGSIQLQNPVLIENEKGTFDFDKSWITEATVKELMDTPLTNNITTNVYKVNALVKEVPGSGFTNFYFFDIDGKTGSYTYSSCNGSDFTYLREFDNKICTVYLSVISAKSTAAKAVYRFMPIDVSFDNYTFDSNKAPEYALTYEAEGQFRSYYAAGAKEEILSSVVNSSLFEGEVALSYKSNNTSVVSFETEGSKTILNPVAAGEAEVEITATYGSNTKTTKVNLLVKQAPSFEGSTVAEAIAAEAGAELSIKAVAGPSLVNQTGFYLIDKTGAIAVLCTDDVLSNIEYGDVIAVKTTRVVRRKDGSTEFGQSHLQVDELLFNYGIKEEYAKDSIKNATFSELIGLCGDATIDQTTQVYRTKVYVKSNEGAYSSTYELYGESGTGDKIILYTSSGSQYNGLLGNYKNQVVEVEIALCNWNCKGYKGCVLAVIDNGETIPNVLNY